MTKRPRHSSEYPKGHKGGNPGLFLYFHTLRHLKPIQIWGRLLFRLRRPTPDLSAAPQRRSGGGVWRLPAARRQSLVSAMRFRFLNEEHEVVSGGDWNSPGIPKLWLYNLHYFDDLNAQDAASRAAWHALLLARWIAENPPGVGNGWEPYPLSLRLVNWLKWVLAGNELSGAAVHSLAVQARFLTRRLEVHLLGNHLFANAKALVFAGAFFEGAEADAWFRLGMEILRREIAEQILADGGHFERSTMYQALALEDMLDLSNLARAFPAAFAGWQTELDRWPTLIDGMARWLEAMSHPDGEISFFNDAAMGVAPSPSALMGYAQRLDIPVVAEMSDGVIQLEQSGYIRMQMNRAVLLFDGAPVGPDYLPGHAHADTLSFELSWGLQRVICNSGTSRYGRDAIRLWERSTAAHNTVAIDGADSSEVWDGFRVARRAYPVGFGCAESAEALGAWCAHDGYMRLPGRPVHRRTVEVSGDEVRWTDEVTGAGEHRAVGRIPLHPEVKARRLNEAQWLLVLPSGAQLVLALETAGVKLDEETGRYSPEFGLTLERTVLTWAVSGVPPFLVVLSLRPMEA